MGVIFMFIISNFSPLPFSKPPIVSVFITQLVVLLLRRKCVYIPCRLFSQQKTKRIRTGISPISYHHTHSSINSLAKSRRSKQKREKINSITTTVMIGSGLENENSSTPPPHHRKWNKSEKNKASGTATTTTTKKRTTAAKRSVVLPHPSQNVDMHVRRYIA